MFGAPLPDIAARDTRLTHAAPPHHAPRSGQRRALAGKPTWLEAPESYCSEAMYFLEHHSHCFDSLRAYYEADMRLFGLPTCEDE